MNPIKLKQMQERNAFVEEEIPRLEALIVETETALGNFISVAETQRQSALLEDLRVRHTVLLAEWEELALALEEAVS
jgi:ATP-binding cassette subfamily F protein 3